MLPQSCEPPVILDNPIIGCFTTSSNWPRMAIQPPGRRLADAARPSERPEGVAGTIVPALIERTQTKKPSHGHQEVLLELSFQPS